MIEGISTRRVESTPASDPTLGVASRQQQEQRGERQAGAQSSTFGDTLSLSPEAQQQLSKLQQRDREVRSHEQAHISAGGPHVTGGASYSYTKGPDGRQYAIGGSVSIDTSTIPGNPEATEEKARMVRSAALAPGAPSAQDQGVAAQAASMEMQAQTEKRAQQDEKNSPQGNPDDGPQAVAAQGNAQPAEPLQGAEPVQPAQAASSTGTDPLRSAEGTLNPASGSEGRNTGYLFGAMEGQVRGDKVAALYQAQQDKFIPPTALAPNGTGIGITV